MKFRSKVKIIIKFGPKQKDNIEIDTDVSEIRWDENSFIIRGLFRKNMIKIGEENGKHIDRNIN